MSIFNRLFIISQTRFLKPLFIFTVLFLFLMPVNFSNAAQREFDYFSVNIPSGWKANQDGDTVLILRNDHSASMSVTWASTPP